MKIAEYKLQLNQLSDQFNIQKRNLDIQFVKANNKCKLGETISDINNTIKISKMTLGFIDTTPVMIYHNKQGIKIIQVNII